MAPTPFRMSEPARSTPRFATWNEPGMLGILGDDSRTLAGEIVGLEAGVRMMDGDGVGSMGDEESEPEDSGELSTSSPTARSGETSSTDGLLLGIGGSQGL